MTRWWGVLFSLFFALCAWGQPCEIDSLLLRLDRVISQRTRYSQTRQTQIDSLKNRLSLVRSDEEHFLVYQGLFDKYSNYRMDSAFWAAECCESLAERIPNPLYFNSAKIRLADVMIETGMYKEGLEMLGYITVSQLNHSDLLFYYNLFIKVYAHLAETTFLPRLQNTYNRLAHQYKDSILSVCRPNSQGYQVAKANQLAASGRLCEALSLLRKVYQVHVEKQYNLAIPAILLADLYSRLGDRLLQKKYLTISAIADIEGGNKEYVSLWKLANLLYLEGDINRAYNYMACSMQDAIFCHAHYRMQEIGKLLPVVNQAYEEKLVREKNQFFLFFVILSVLGGVLLMSLGYIYVQMKRLAQAKQTVHSMNEKLAGINKNLCVLNDKLVESNRVKEEYIGYVFHMCSTYIDKQDEFRKVLARKMKAGRVEELYQLVSSTTFVANELKDFFKMFDSVFLKLYPNFIDDFNALLQKGEQFLVKDGELLTPELRIFALIRLGITDSGRIAAFLHYSSQTVYNYRLKVRNKSRYSKEEFLKLLQTIG